MIITSLIPCLRFNCYSKGPSTKNIRQMGRGGFEISDVPEGVVCENPDVRKIEIPNYPIAHELK